MVSCRSAAEDTEKGGGGSSIYSRLFLELSFTFCCFCNTAT